MKNLIKKVKGFKIIPEKFKSSTIFDVEEFFDNDFSIKLYQTEEMDINDYIVNNEVEIFGLGEEGLIYFISSITDKNDKELKIKYPESYKSIQRRESSRVDFKGTLELVDFKEAIIEPIDISAGGLKFFSDANLENEKTYQVKLKLNNNININSDIEILKTFNKQETANDIRAKFVNINSTDRIALIQYSFQILLENENK